MKRIEKYSKDVSKWLQKRPLSLNVISLESKYKGESIFISANEHRQIRIAYYARNYDASLKQHYFGQNIIHFYIDSIMEDLFKKKKHPLNFSVSDIGFKNNQEAKNRIQEYVDYLSGEV